MASYEYFGRIGEVVPRDTARVIIHSSVRVIDGGAFQDCRDSLEVVMMHDDITIIEDDTFFSCYALEYIKLSRNLQRIGNRALQSCHSLGAIFLPTTLRSIGNDALRDCRSLRFLDVPEQIEEFGDGIITECSEFRTSIEQNRNSHSMELSDGDEMQEWLIHRHENFPLHRVCYNTNVTAQDILACIIENGAGSAWTVDDQSMTAMHVIAANPHATQAAISACYYANIKAATMIDNNGSIPIHYLCQYNPSMLTNLSWLERERGCFEVVNDEGFTPLDVLAGDDNSGLLPVTIAVKHNIKWGNGMQYIIEENMVAKEWNSLVKKDPKTGLHIFQLAAVGRDADLSTIFKLLLVNPGLVVI